MEQTLGHRSHTQTLGWGVENDNELEADWSNVEFESQGLPWSLPVVSSNWSVRGSLKAISPLRRAVAGQFDALFIHTITISLFAGKYMDRVPTVLSADATPENYDQVGSWYGHKKRPRPIEYLKRRMRRRVFRKAAAIITWCHWAEDSLITDYGVDRERIHVIAPGAAIDMFPFGAERHVNGSGRPVKLLFVGGDFHRKGGEVLLKVHRAALRGRTELHLVTQEDVPPEDGVFVYRGVGSNSPELLSLYRDADVFVLPTLGDCFPVVLGEAMAAGLPIVTTDVGALPEAVKHGDNGFVVPAGDDVALASALNVLVENKELRVQMGLAGRRLAEEMYDSKVNAQRVIDVLKGVCRDRQRSESDAVTAGR
jgi:glycosyltransferase involved in cell wall biosynthesis